MSRRSVFLLLLTPLCGALGCDAPADGLPADAGPVDRGPVPDSAPPPPRKGPGEPCVADQCARGSCVDGVCSALCARDEDCQPETPLCVGRSGAGRCSATCRSTADCAAGLICAVVAVDTGICVAPGPGVDGEACAAREDCASWFCGDGRCRAACDAQRPCAAGERCLPLHTQAVCAPIGPGERESPCTTGAECASGVCRGGRCSDVCPDGACADERVCLRYPAANLCEQRCADSGDCGEGGLCLLVGSQRLCVTRGLGAPGERCVAAADCASGRCDLGQCATPCPPEGCPAGTACVRDITGAACRPAGPAAPGARCAQGSVCASGVCGGGICTADCAADPCPEGTRCVDFADGAFCFPGCAEDGDCASPAFCDPRFEPGPICFWRGAAGVGEACADHRDCASGRCVDGACLGACTAECPAGLGCVSVGTGRFCVAPPLPLEAACDAPDACAEGLACIAGRCLPDCAGGCPPSAICRANACHPRCGDDLDCRAGRICDRLLGACIEPGPGAADALCADAADCAAGLCLDGRCRARCAAGCGADVCVELGRDGLCLTPGPAAAGAPCDRHDACATGLCLGRRCARRCDETACPPGTACAPVAGDAWCVGRCAAAADCEADEVCAVGSDGAGVCVVAPDPPTVGEPCADDGACGADAAACVAGPDGQRCRAPCRQTADCPADRVCAPRAAADGLGACVPPGPGDPLAPCDAGADCASGWCIADYLDGRCGAPCVADADCAGACVDLARDPAAPSRVCAARCAADDDCPAPLRCRRARDGDGACY